MIHEILLLSMLSGLGSPRLAADIAVPVERLDNGVAISHILQGKGPRPSPDSRVRVHYRGTLLDGTEFDSSHKRGSPAEFSLSQVIPCWTSGVSRMRVGGKAKLACPASTAYGTRGVPGLIPPNSVLRFEVELIAILP